METTAAMMAKECTAFMAQFGMLHTGEDTSDWTTAPPPTSESCRAPPETLQRNQGHGEYKLPQISKAGGYRAAYERGRTSRHRRKHDKKIKVV